MVSHGTPSYPVKIANTIQYKMKQGLQELSPIIDTYQRKGPLCLLLFPLATQSGHCSILIKDEWLPTIDYYSCKSMTPLIKGPISNIIEIIDFI